MKDKKSPAELAAEKVFTRLKQVSPEPAWANEIITELTGIINEAFAEEREDVKGGIKHLNEKLDSLLTNFATLQERHDRMAAYICALDTSRSFSDSTELLERFGLIDAGGVELLGAITEAAERYMRRNEI